MADKVVTHGFGVPNDTMPHQFLVRIPKSRNDPVEVWEDFGAAAAGTAVEKICRGLVPRDVWGRVSDGVKSHLNRRLREKDFKASRFSIGDNRVERILGREVCVLAWAIEDVDADEAAVALTRWSSHRPEELWWLFLQIDNDGGDWDSPRTGWRIAVRHAMIREGESAPASVRRRHLNVPGEMTPNLFSDH